MHSHHIDRAGWFQAVSGMLRGGGPVPAAKGLAPGAGRPVLGPSVGGPRTAAELAAVVTPRARVAPGRPLAHRDDGPGARRSGICLSTTGRLRRLRRIAAGGGDALSVDSKSASPKHRRMVLRQQQRPALAEFGERLRAVRLALGLSQEALADLAGFDRTYVSLVERGRRSEE